MSWWCWGALCLGGLGCSLRNLGDLEGPPLLADGSDPGGPSLGSSPVCDGSPEASACDPAEQASCGVKGASCEQLPDRSGCRHSFCRWSTVADQRHCAAVTRIAFWLPARGALAQDYPLAVPEGSAGACVTPIENLSCGPVRAEWCAEHGASCDLAKNTGPSDVVNLCRWSAATSPELCAAQPEADWIPADSSFARDHLGSVAPDLPGACISSADQPLSTRTEFCFDLQPAFVENGGDDPAPGENELGRGIRFRISDALGNSSVYDADPVSGCRAVNLDTFGSYRVSALSHLTLADGNEVSVLEDDADSLEYESLVSSALVPGSLGQTQLKYTWSAAPAGESADVATVLAALERSFGDHALTSGQLYRVYLGGGTCGNPCVARDAAGERSIFLSLARRDRFLISSMVAALGSQLRFGGVIGSAVGAAPDCGLADPSASSCANGATHLYGNDEFRMGTEEYGNCAFASGWAQYVAASVWNRPDQTDCQFRGVDCYEPGSAAAACYGGAPQTLDTGFERDWLTALWALQRADGCGLAFPTIVSILEGAKPLEWTNASARSALIGAAPLYLTGSALDCFTNTLLARISR